MKRQTSSVCAALALVTACVVQAPGVLDAGDTADVGGTAGDDPTGDPTGSGDTGSASDTGDGDPNPDPGPSDGDGCAQALDVLVVIDNSGSMAGFQRRLADSFPILIDGLDQAGVDWRLAFTTTDNGNPWCPAGTTTPEAGSFVFSGCTTRLGDFLFGNDVDTQAIGCTDICGLDPAQLEPSPTSARDGLMKARPWLQREAGQLNVAADASDAIRCLLPQGVNGCGFESQLESMRRGLARTTQAGAPEAGFLRDDASLLIVMVSDEVDCSSQPKFSEIFDAEGNKVFWSDPLDAFPSSAVCWNAGVDCIGDPNGYDDCVAANKDVYGDPASDADAVLYPVSRYQDVLTQIEAYKREVSNDDGLDVAMLAITGVGLDGTIDYADSSDPAFQYSFGIGAGCTDPGNNPWATAGVPPVRIREVATHVSTQPLASICAPNFDAYMLGLLDHFVGAC